MPQDRTSSGAPLSDLPELRGKLRPPQDQQMPATLAGRLVPVADSIRQLKRAKDRRYYLKNKAKLAEKRRAKAAAGLLKAHKRKDYERHREAYTERARRWREDNRERYNANARSRFARDPSLRAKRATYTQRRLARLRKLPFTLTPQDWEGLLEEHGRRCAYCGSADRLERDHVIPLSRGGATTKENIVPACRTCNRKKGARIALR